MRLNIDCREATRLILLRQDRPLTRTEQVALRMHLWICDPCPRFVRQTQLMRGAMARWKAYADGGENADGSR